MVSPFRLIHHWLWLLLLASAFIVFCFIALPSLQQLDTPRLDNPVLANVKKLNWSELIPNEEKALLQKYQIVSPMSFEEQTLNALQAANDENYEQALVSTHTLSEFDNLPIQIPGFVVPLEFDDNRSITRFFLVPYLGACIHYPPPPPNQIIYVNANQGVDIEDLNQAYLIAGVIKQGLFEDPLGTSAYMLMLEDIRPFASEPDDFRSHQ